MLARRLRKIALKFATENFASCDVHQTEAIAVHQALQYLCENELPQLKRETLVREILLPPMRLANCSLHTHFQMDSLDRVELATAIEGERGSISDFEVDNFVDDLKRTHQIFDTLLGSVSRASRWDPVTIWSRSIYSIINERVRHREGCSCG
jgi:hypothetical protein